MLGALWPWNYFLAAPILEIIRYHICTCVCYGFEVTPGAIHVWLITIESYVLDGVLGSILLRGATLKGAFSFNVHSMSVQFELIFKATQ